jgi:exopolyphosphatase/guanosine-5'-triphosphate,3'-diphosphate pyrophosphatase
VQIRREQDAAATRLTAFQLFAAETLRRYLQVLVDEHDSVRCAEERRALHRMRVASRRLRSLLPWFAVCLPAKQYTVWRKEIRRLARALGVARDTDVQIASVEHYLEADSEEHERLGVSRLLLRLQQQRQQQQGQVVAALERVADRRLLDDMEETLHALAAPAHAYRVERQSPYVYRKARKAMRSRLKALLAYEPYIQQPDCHKSLHAMRLATKRLRYMMQACAPLYQGALEAPIHAVETLQDMLGDIHDCDVWDDYLGQFVEAERARTLAYFGHTTSFEQLVSGMYAFRANRQRYRAQRYQDFVAFWQELHAQQMWEHLRQTLTTYAEPALPTTVTTPVSSATEGVTVVPPAVASDPEHVKAAVLELAQQCQYEEVEHAQHVTRLALRLFDGLQPQHGLGTPERLWLEWGALLHDIGWIEGQQQHHKTSLRLILDSALLPVSPRERLLVAAVARYHRRALPSNKHKHFAALDSADKQRVRVLAGILRVADGLDRTHRSLVDDLSCDVAPEQIVVRCTTNGDTAEEYRAARDKGRLFEAVFQCQLEIV